ncbi:MAG: zinc ribbon domain-containing protein [Solirubrobacteraceae bacterium]
MLRIFRGERPAVDGSPDADEREQSNAISIESDASRPLEPEPGQQSNSGARTGERPSAEATRASQPVSEGVGERPSAEATPASQPVSEGVGDAPPAADAAQAAQTSDAPGPEAQPEPSAGAAGFLSRGNIRRRARFLRAARELAYRDLGGLVFDLHRFDERNDEVLAAKLATLSRIDVELRALEQALEQRAPIAVLRSAGVTACPRCAAIHGSSDRFCPACGLAVRADARPIAPTAPGPPPATMPAGPADAGTLTGEASSQLERHATRSDVARVQQPTQAFDPPTEREEAEASQVRGDAGEGSSTATSPENDGDTQVLHRPPKKSDER